MTKKIYDVFRKITMETFSLALAILARITPKNKQLILLGGFNGKHFGDNAAFLLKELNKSKSFRAIWMCNDPKVIQEVKKTGGEAVLRRSLKGIVLSLQTPIIATSHSIKDALMFTPFKGYPHFIYLHHGIPLRKGWLQLKNAPPSARKAVWLKTKKARCMIAPSTWAAEIQNKMYPIGVENYQITGLPRNDLFFEQGIKPKLRAKYNFKKEDKILLYAPTWRPWGATAFFPFTDFSIKQLGLFLERENIKLIIRPHHLDLNHHDNISFWKQIAQLQNAAVITHAECADINELAILSDMLITDYSSLIFDYLLLDKPMIFFDYDLQRYQDQIGFYVPYKEVSIGPHPKTFSDFKSTAIHELKNDTYRKKRNELCHRFHSHQDGYATKRVVNIIKKILSSS